MVAGRGSSAQDSGLSAGARLDQATRRTTSPSFEKLFPKARGGSWEPAGKAAPEEMVSFFKKSGPRKGQESLIHWSQRLILKIKSTIHSPPIDKDLGSFRFPAYILEGCGTQRFHSGLGEFYPCLGPAGNGPRDVWLRLGLLFWKGRTQLDLSCWLSKSHLKLNKSKANSITFPPHSKFPITVNGSILYLAA